VDIMYGEGISKDGDLLDLGAQLGLVQKSGAWFSYGETRLGQGRENAKTYLREHPEIRHEIENSARIHFGMKPLEALTAPDNYISVDPDKLAEDTDDALEIEIIDLEGDDD